MMASYELTTAGARTASLPHALFECGSSYGLNLGVSEELTESFLADYLQEQVVVLPPVEN